MMGLLTKREPTLGKLAPEVKARWVEELRSGRHKQGRSYLRRRRAHYKTEECCLGVLCPIIGLEFEPVESFSDGDDIVFGAVVPDEPLDSLFRRNPGTIPNHLAIRVGLTMDAQVRLQTMNDGIHGNGEGSKSFAEIADWIEANL